jgi:hypothetical protein
MCLSITRSEHESARVTPKDTHSQVSGEGADPVRTRRPRAERSAGAGAAADEYPEPGWPEQERGRRLTRFATAASSCRKMKKKADRSSWCPARLE